MNTPHWTRRDFLKACSQAAVGATHARATLGLLGGLGAASASAANSDYRALVCIFLFGGADTYNLLVRRDSEGYATYSATRSNMALPAEQLLPVSGLGSLPYEFGLHPAATELATLFDQGRLAFLANVGSLVAPVTKDDYLAGRNLPKALFSHNDQQDLWASAYAQGGASRGWAGGIADLLVGSGSGGELPINLSLFGNNLYQSGNLTSTYVMSSSGVTPLRVTSDGNSARNQAFREIAAYALLSSDPLAQHDARVLDSTMQISDAVYAALTTAPTLNTAFPATDLGAQLAMVARMIAVREQFASRRQIFFVGIGGWDTHDVQIDALNGLYATLSQALGAFDAAMLELGTASQVTAFTMSDFARTLTSNGDGTDHAWGSMQLISGGAVLGGQVYGQFPDQTLDGPEDAGYGRIIASTAVDQYAATLARWFGLDNSELATLLPNLYRFSTPDLRFMG